MKESKIIEGMPGLLEALDTMEKILKSDVLYNLYRLNRRGFIAVLCTIIDKYTELHDLDSKEIAKRILALITSKYKCEESE
jgi:hypothetical protein